MQYFLFESETGINEKTAASGGGNTAVFQSLSQINQAQVLAENYVASSSCDCTCGQGGEHRCGEKHFFVHEKLPEV